MAADRLAVPGTVVALAFVLVLPAPAMAGIPGTSGISVEERWRVTLDDEQRVGGAVVDGEAGTVYAGMYGDRSFNDGRVVAYVLDDAAASADPEVRWERDDWSPETSVLVASVHGLALDQEDEALYAGLISDRHCQGAGLCAAVYSPTFELHRLDATTGATDWYSVFPWPNAPTEVLLHDDAVVGIGTGWVDDSAGLLLGAADQEDGTQAWRLEIRTDEAPAILSHAVDEASGRLHLLVDAGPAQDRDVEIITVSLDDGTVLWRRAPMSDVAGSGADDLELVDDGERLIVGAHTATEGADRPHVLALDPETGEPGWTWPHPMLSGTDLHGWGNVTGVETDPATGHLKVLVNRVIGHPSGDDPRGNRLVTLDPDTGTQLDSWSFLNGMARQEQALDLVQIPGSRHLFVSTLIQDSEGDRWSYISAVDLRDGVAATPKTPEPMESWCDARWEPPWTGCSLEIQATDGAMDGHLVTTLREPHAVHLTGYAYSVEATDPAPLPGPMGP